MEDPVVPVPTDSDLHQAGVPEPGAPVALVGDPLPAVGEQTLDSLVNLEEDNNQWLQSNDDSFSDVEPKVLFCLHANNPLRAVCIKIYQSSWFRYAMLAVIILNVLYFAILESPTFPKQGTILALQLTFQSLFMFLFWIEMLIKITAVGFKAYITNGWNILDFILNIYGIISLIPSVANFNILRTFRVLNALRLFRNVAGVKSIVDALVFSVPHLIDVALVILFLYFVFGLTGMQTWMGSYRQYCVSETTGLVDTATRLCSMTEERGRQCPTGYICSNNVTGLGNPNYGYTGFDNIGQAFLTLYGLSTFDGWSFTMYLAMDVDGFPVWIFFVAFILLCTFFSWNLVIAVILSRFHMFSDKEREARAKIPHTSDPLSEETMSMHGFRGKVRRFVRHRLFNAAIFCCIFINTILLMTDYYGIPDGYRTAVTVINIIFTVIYVAEAGLKLAAFGPRRYFHSRWNIFDFVVSITSITELIISAILGKNTFLLIFRTIRMMRVFNLIPLWYGLERVLRTVVQVRTSLFLGGIILFFSFIFALIGRQLFGGKMVFADAGRPRWHFDDLWFAFLTTWQVIMGDSWMQVLYDCMRVNSFGALYFLIVNCFGAIIFAKLFTGILLDKFSMVPDKVEAVKGKEGQFIVSQDHERALQNEDEEISDEEVEEMIDQGGPNAMHLLTVSDIKNRVKKRLADKSAVLYNGIQGVGIRGTEVFLEKQSSKRKPKGKSLGFLSVDNPLRKLCINVFMSPYSEYVLLMIICANCVVMAMESPKLTREYPIFAEILYASEWIFIAIYLLEVIGKIIAFGFVRGDTAFLRPTKGWNIVDTIVILLSLISLFVPRLAPIRALRSLRVLRVISRFEGSKIAVRALVNTLPAAGNASVVILIIWTIFGVLGVNLYKGQFWRCNDSTVNSRIECEGYFIDPTGLNQTRMWYNPPYHFDNIGAALLSLFVISTREGGVDVMYSAMDANGIGMQPKRDSNPANAWFFVAFGLIGVFYCLALLSGTVIDSFTRMKKRYHGAAFLTEKQQKWVTTQRILLNLRPEKPFKPPKRPNRVLFFYLVTSEVFKWVIKAVIVLNLLVLAIRYEGAPAGFNSFASAMNWVFLGIYCLEAALKLIGLGPAQYFGSPSEMNWQKFEFVLIMMTLGVQLAGFQLESPLVRVLRALPIIRLIQGASRLRVVFDTLLFSIPSLANISVLIFCVYFIYAVFGVYIVGSIKYQSFEGLNDYANFDDFPHAMLTLFRVSTLDRWAEIMRDTWVQPPNCIPGDPANECGSFGTFFYFMSFLLIQSYVMFNLVLAVLLENYNEYYRVYKYAQNFYFQEFVRLWKEKDPDGHGKIDAAAVWDILVKLGPPLGFDRKMKRLEVLHEFRKMNIPISQSGKVYYEHFLRATTLRSLFVEISGVIIDDERRNKLSTFTMQHWWAARLLQRKWRLEASNFKLRRLGRYDELIEGSSKTGRASTLYRAIAILDAQATAVKERNPSSKISIQDVIENETLGLLFSKFCEKNYPQLKQAQFLKDVKDIETCISDWKCYEIATMMNRNYFTSGLKVLGIGAKEQRLLRQDIEKYLESVRVLATPPPVTSISRTEATRRAARGASPLNLAALPDAPVKFNRQLFSATKQLVIEAMNAEVFSKFLDWEMFATYCKNQVKTAIILQQQNDDLVRQLAELQQKKAELSKSRGDAGASQSSSSSSSSY